MSPFRLGSRSRQCRIDVLHGRCRRQGVAFQKLRRTDAEAVESVKRGSGMIVCFDRGRVIIVNAASCEWVAGLIARDPFVEKVTSNVLKRFTAR